MVAPGEGFLLKRRSVGGALPIFEAAWGTVGVKMTRMNVGWAALEATNWAELEHAYGSGVEVPVRILRMLAELDVDAQRVARDFLVGRCTL